MNPEEIANALQHWATKNSPSLKTLRRTVTLLMAERYSVDPVKGLVFDQIEEATGTVKEGFTAKVIQNSVEEFKIQFINSIIELPKPKVGRSIAGSSIDEREQFNVVKLYLENYTLPK